MSENTPSNDALNEITNYQELFQSEGFKRVIKIAIQKSGYFNEKVIMSIFEQLGKGEELSDQERENLISFADNKNVEQAIQPILTKLKKSKLLGTENVEQQKSFGEFLKLIFAEKGFEIAKIGILDQAGVDVSQRVGDTVNYTQEVQDRRRAWDELAGELSIDASMVEATNSGISIEGVAKFELNDDEPASYDDLKKAGKLDNRADDEWDKLSMFMTPWKRGQKETFLTKVMKMDTTRKGDWNFYISTSASPRDDYVQGLNIGKHVVEPCRQYRNLKFSVRRVQK